MPRNRWYFSLVGGVEGYGRVVPGNPDKKTMSDINNLLTFVMNNLEIQVNDDNDKQKLTVINLPPGIIQCIEDNEEDDNNNHYDNCQFVSKFSSRTPTNQ